MSKSMYLLHIETVCTLSTTAYSRSIIISQFLWLKLLSLCLYFIKNVITQYYIHINKLCYNWSNICANKYKYTVDQEL